MAICTNCRCQPDDAPCGCACHEGKKSGEDEKGRRYTCGKELTQFDRGVRCGERLIGTCSSIEKEVEEGDEWQSQEFLDGVESVAFECNECGWWCEVGEATAGHDGSEDVCQDCAPDED